MRRTTTLLAAAVLACAGLATACVQTPAATTSTTTTLDPWMSGCYDSGVTLPADQTDLSYTGPASTFHNAQLNVSSDGACAGGWIAEVTVVRAPDGDAAYAACIAIDPGYTYVLNLKMGGGYAAAPADAFLCTPTGV